jgi:hypothetical protein
MLRNPGATRLAAIVHIDIPDVDRAGVGDCVLELQLRPRGDK